MAVVNTPEQLLAVYYKAYAELNRLEDKATDVIVKKILMDGYLHLGTKMSMLRNQLKVKKDKID